MEHIKSDVPVIDLHVRMTSKELKELKDDIEAYVDDPYGATREFLEILRSL